MHTIGAESDNSSVRRMMNDIEDGLRSGERFSECLERYPKVFPPFYRGIVRSAELTGELDTVLARLSGYIERDLEARRKIKSALIYPLVVSGMSVVTVLILSIYVLPKFKDFFASLDAELPLPTRMLMGFTGFLGDWWWAICIGLLALVLLYVLPSPAPPRGSTHATRCCSRCRCSGRPSSTPWSSASAASSARWSAPA